MDQVEEQIDAALQEALREDADDESSEEDAVDQDTDVSDSATLALAGSSQQVTCMIVCGYVSLYALCACRSCLMGLSSAAIGMYSAEQ